MQGSSLVGSRSGAKHLAGGQAWHAALSPPICESMGVGASVPGFLDDVPHFQDFHIVSLTICVRTSCKSEDFKMCLISCIFSVSHGCIVMSSIICTFKILICMKVYLIAFVCFGPLLLKSSSGLWKGYQTSGFCL